MNGHWIISLYISVDYFRASLHHHLPPLCLHFQWFPLAFPFLWGHWQLELGQLFIILYVAMTLPLRLMVRTESPTFSYMPDQTVCWGVFPGPPNPITSICRRFKSCLHGLTRWDQKKMFSIHSGSFSGLQIQLLFPFCLKQKFKST